MPSDEPFGFPVAFLLDGLPVPDLSRLPRKRWREVLAPLPHSHRRRAANTVDSWDAFDAAKHLIGDIDLEDAGRAQAARRATNAVSLPGASARPLPAAPGRRQVNVKLGAVAHARLVQAAVLLDARPTQLARMLVVNGCNRVLYDHRREVSNDR